MILFTSTAREGREFGRTSRGSSTLPMAFSGDKAGKALSNPLNRVYSSDHVRTQETGFS